MGCPRATAPPQTFTFAGSNPRILLFARLTAEKAYMLYGDCRGEYLIDFPFCDIFDFETCALQCDGDS
jgi:hypothetical protein